MVEDNKGAEKTSGLAASVAMGRGGDRAETYLDEQTRLTRLQITQIEEEEPTRRRLLRIEHASALFKLALEVAVAAVAAVIVIGLASMMWNASRDNGLVVESFSVPPDLAGRGLTGDVVAARLLDKLSTLQSDTVSSRAPSSYANNWGNDIKLQIPDTGVSIGEFNRSLHVWLGNQTRITGEIFRTPSGLAVTARTGTNPGPTFTGGDAELDALIQKAAESVYRATQPYRYAVYLNNAGRVKESEQAYLALIANGTITDRAWALIGLENIYANRPDFNRAIKTLDRAQKIKPDFFMAYTNRAGIEGQFQHDEAALAAQARAAAIMRGPRDPDMSDIAWKLGALQSEATLAADLGDFRAQLDFDRQIETLPEFNNTVGNARQNDIVANAFLHDYAASEAAFEALPEAAGDLSMLQRDGTHSFARVLLGDPDLIVSRRKQFNTSLAKLGPLGMVISMRQFWPIAAFAMAMKGDFKGAHALADRTPIDCSQCLRVRAGIDALEKNWPGAEYWYRRAVKDSPTPPFAWTDWGRMLLSKGDYDGAIGRFEIAHAKSAHFADPIALWGEALIKKGRSDLAVEKFAQANLYAPHWGRLHLKWGEALSFLGRKDDARGQFAIARGLGMTAQEKAELASAQHG